MSLLIPDLLTSAAGNPESNTNEFFSQGQSGTSGSPFVEVMASLVPGMAEDTGSVGQSFAALTSQAQSVGWAPALTVMPLGESLQLITPGAEQGAETSLEDFARAQGLDELTIGWLMGQTESLPAAPLADDLAAAMPAASTALSSVQAINGSVLAAGMSTTGMSTTGMSTTGMSANGLTASTLSALTPNGWAQPPGLAPSVTGPLACDTPALEAVDQDALSGLASAPAKSANGLAVQGLPVVSAAALWAPVDPQRSVVARSGAPAQQPVAEPTESLMATLRSPAATVLTALQKQLQNVADPNLPSSKTAANLRTYDSRTYEGVAKPGDSGT